MSSLSGHIAIQGMPDSSELCKHLATVFVCWWCWIICTCVKY